MDVAEGTVRIELLEVHFDVAGDGDREFAKLFERYINQWSRMQNERDCRDHRARGIFPKRSSPLYVPHPARLS